MIKSTRTLSQITPVRLARAGLTLDELRARARDHTSKFRQATGMGISLEDTMDSTSMQLTAPLGGGGNGFARR